MQTKQTPRSLALVDADNLLGGLRFTPHHAASDMRADFERVADLDPRYLAVVGSDVSIAIPVGLAFAGKQLVVGRGTDGADRALLAAVGPVHRVAERFDRIVIGSGDGRAFAVLARTLRSAGVEVWVVARPGSLSRALAAQAHVVRYLVPSTGAELRVAA